MSVRNVSLTSALKESLIVELILKVIIISAQTSLRNDMTLQWEKRMFMFAVERTVDR